MKKIAFVFGATKRWLQLVLLVSVLLLGWLVASILRWVKGDDWYQKQKTAILPSSLGIDTAKADSPGGSAGSSATSSTTPFLAVWNGKKFEIENDFLFGRPRSYFANFNQGKKAYEKGQIGPDLYKIQIPFWQKGGKLAFQIQEIEPEESFINGVNLLRVIHAKNSEVIVDSDYKRFYVVDKKSFSRNLILSPLVQNSSGKKLTHLSKKENFWHEPIKETFLCKQDYVDLTFRNLKPGVKYFLVNKTRYRNWLMGEGPPLLAQAQSIASYLLRSSVLSKAAFSALLSLAFLSTEKGISWLPNVLVILTESASSGGSGGSCESMGCCLPIFYKSQEDKFCYARKILPRTWRYNSELLELPTEAVLNSGKMHLRVVADHESHYLGFVGLVKELPEVLSKVETLNLDRAYHHRLKKEVADQLGCQRGRYLQTIPGDVIDLEFELPQSSLSEGEKETYLFGSRGFYTYLSPFSKMIAGEWEKKLSPEARERLEVAKQENQGA